MHHIVAISLDLDGTLWDIEAVMVRAERRLRLFIENRFPSAAARFDDVALRRLRAEVAADHPQFAHDFTTQRRLTFERMLTASGYTSSNTEHLMDVYLDARHDLEPYPDVVPALERLSARFPLATLSNGNADMHRLGLQDFFTDSITATRVGALKPSPRMFDTVCGVFGVDPEQVLHVGDHPIEDIRGATDAGMRTAWINRRGQTWTHHPHPDCTVTSLTELADMLDDL